jgi:cell division protein FtsQ
MWNNARQLNLLAATVVFAALVGWAAEGLYWFVHRPMFNLRGVTVEAESGTLRHVSLATIRSEALPEIRGNFFSTDLESVRKAFENVAWVRHARIRREWPNRLAVRIEEHEALGTWNDDRLMNTAGEVFAANLAEAEADGELPRFYGPDGSEKDVRQRFADFSAWFAPLGLKPFEVALSPRYAWQVRLDNGTASGLAVKFGREDDRDTLRERVNRLEVAYPAIAEKWPHLTLVDLRYPNGFALRAEGLRLAEDPKARPRPGSPSAMQKSRAQKPEKSEKSVAAVGLQAASQRART